MAVDFYISPSSDPSAERVWTGVFMELEVIHYFARLAETTDVFGLDQLDEHGERFWSPDDAEQLEGDLTGLSQAIREFLGTARNSVRPDLEPPETVGQYDHEVREFGRHGLQALLHSLVVVFALASERHQFVSAIGD